jgi:hypothetical protein
MVDLLYPNGNAGDFDEQTLAAARAAVYRSAVRTRPGTPTRRCRAGRDAGPAERLHGLRSVPTAKLLSQPR